ncbi:MAG: glycosyltransferase family 2 protein, partial [Bryobacteraceae bacterium]
IPSRPDWMDHHEGTLNNRMHRGGANSISASRTAASRPTPSITVVISTRDRGDTVCKAIRSLLLNDYPHFDLIVVDQSESGKTGESVEPFLDDPRLRYLKTYTPGVSIGRNFGIARSRSEILAITDDDCEAPPDWLREIAAAFEKDKRIGIVFGNVVPGPHDTTAGFVPAYIRERPFLAQALRDKLEVEGISACMALRRSVWESLGGFDRMLGIGAPLKSAAESDFCLRALLKGHYVYETPKVTLIHTGFRTWEQGRSVIQRYWYGSGAMLMKNIRCGHWAVITILLRLGWRWVFGQSRVGASLGSRQERMLRLKSFVKGFIAGAMRPVDRAKGHFVHQNPDTAEAVVGSKEAA